MKAILVLAALLLAMGSDVAEAKRRQSGGGGSTGGGTSTNYGCSTLPAGTVLTNSSGTSRLTLQTPTAGCYLCNMTTGVCSLQSPSSLYGWTFLLP